MGPGMRGMNRLTMIARRNINPGEELTLCYVNPKMPRSQRRSTLRELYGFWCGCPKCKREEGKAEEVPQGIEDYSSREAKNIIDRITAMSLAEKDRSEKNGMSAGEVEAETDVDCGCGHDHDHAHGGRIHS
jgi:hypothetical protein